MSLNLAKPSTPTARWVLLRGLTREAAHWGDFPLRLRAAWPAAEVHAVDLPGNGRRHREPSPSSVMGMTEAARAQLRADGLGPPYHLLAMSLGAMVAADWATRHPEELVGAVLMNTSLRPFNPWWQRLRPARLPALLALLLPGRSPRGREAAVWRITSRLTPADQVLDAWTSVQAQRPVAAPNALRQLIAAMRFRAGAEPPSVPLLVLTSRGDALVNPACSRTLAARWGATLREHPRAGHDLPLDDGDWVVTQIRQWLEECLSGRGAR